MARSVDEAVIAAARRAGAQSGREAAVLLAVALVETNAVAFAAFRGRREPLIRFEGHYFDRQLSPAKRIAARRLGLADPRAGRVRNPRSQAGRWRLFYQAAAIDAEAAAASVSWGLCQVMGAHWLALGYPHALALAETARRSADGQFEIASRFLTLGGLGAKLARGDTTGFARGYNGPGFRTHRYDTRIGAAYETAKRLLERTAAPAGADGPGGAVFGLGTIVARGQSGDQVRRLQAALVLAGQAIAIDGDFGVRTEAAVRAYQKGADLKADGLAGPATLSALGLQG